MKNTPLVIKNDKNIDAKELKVWNKYTEATSLIKSISATAVVGEGEDNTGKIISGIPTPWARAVIFRYAIEATEDGLASGLKDFYGKIKTEWRSLIAFVALYSYDIKVEKIDLVGDVHKSSDFKARLGSMLFEEEELWRNPNLKDLKDTPPYIQLIKYKVDKNKYVTVGATSPHSIVFTPPKIRSEKRNLTKLIKNGSWIEPTKCDLTQKEVQTIYDCVTYIREHLGNYINLQNRANTVKLNSSSLDTILRKYQEDLKRHPKGRNIKVNNLFNAPKDFFHAPFGILFNAEAKLYEKDGLFYKKSQGAAAFKVEEFLAPSRKAVEIVFLEGKGESADKNTAHLLKVIEYDKDGKPDTRYFAIPLSEKGIIFFQNGLDSLLSQERVIKRGHQLKGELIESEGGIRLKVYLQIEFFTGNPEDDNETDLTIVDRTYELSSSTRLHDERIIVWPDFVASDWKSYYLYNDLPHNLKDGEVRAFPLLGEIKDDKSVLLKAEYSRLTYINIDESGTETEDTNIPEVKLPIKHPVTAADGILRYEIYESQYPFIGVELRVGKRKQQKAGYLITKSFAKTAKEGELKLDFKNTGELKNGRVGIDFGSNNTCISYYSEASDKQKLITLNNRRRFFIGSDRKENDLNVVANSMELFFFNKTKAIGQLKSMLVAHDKNRLANRSDGIKKEVRGGFPLIEKNLPVSGRKTKNIDFYYDLEIDNYQIDAIYNMKWAPDKALNNYKFSYLKTLWLQINAELYTEEHYPTVLRWAHPAAMGKKLINNYSIMWQDVVDEIKPIDNPLTTKLEKLTEGEAVAAYAIESNPGKPGGKLSIGKGTMGIGYDVGGSTTDLLLLIKKDGENSPKLAKQSSILLAAQYLSKAIKRSPQIQEVLIKYLNLKDIKIHGIEKINNDNAPYFLNAVFDRLTYDELQGLYRYFYTNNRKELFAIVSYVSGLILYYTGQLAARVILEENISIEFITKGIYGKGGNIFNWITTVMPDDSNKYYKDCFFAGLGKNKNLDKQIEELEIELQHSSFSDKDLKDAEKELIALENAYKVFPNGAIKQKIDNLKTKIKNYQSQNLDNQSINQEEKDVLIAKLKGELITLNKTLETIDLPEIRKRIGEIEVELEALNNTSSGNEALEAELKILKSIQKVRINNNNEYRTNLKDNKCEVSYGLSSSKPIDKVNNGEIPEIIGEDGYKFNNKILSFTDEITVEYLKLFGGQFEYPNEFKKLEEFSEIYCEFVSKNELLDVRVVQEAVKDLSRTHFQGYVESLQQFTTAKAAGSNFDFKSPMIILEGMCLLENIILKECFK